MSSYVVPSLIAAACAAGVTFAARHALRSRAERRAADIWDAEFMAALFSSSPEATFEASPEATRAAAPEAAGDTATDAHEVPAPRIPRQDPAMAASTADGGGTDGTATTAIPPLRSTTPHPSQGLPPMLPAHLTGAHLLGVAARGTAVTGLRSGTAGGLDVFDFADGGSIVVMPSDPEVAELVDAALEQGQEVRLLGTSEVGGGRSMTFAVHESTAYVLADRVYARPAA